jgi:hypothetical protein
MANLNREKVVDSWNALVINGAGKDKWMIDQLEETLKVTDIPGVQYRREEITASFMGEKREFIILSHYGLKDYTMYINIRPYAGHLDVSWYLTLEPGFLKRTVSKYTQGNPQALSMNIDLFSQQDLSAYVGVVHNLVKTLTKTVMEDLKQDTGGLSTKSKGFLSVW